MAMVQKFTHFDKIIQIGLLVNNYFRIIKVELERLCICSKMNTMKKKKSHRTYF